MHAQFAHYRRIADIAWEKLYAEVETQLLNREAQLSAEVLAAHPAGYSTTAHDFFRDLIPQRSNHNEKASGFLCRQFTRLVGRRGGS
jgi:hypothetical protein